MIYLFSSLNFINIYNIMARKFEVRFNLNSFIFFLLLIISIIYKLKIKTCKISRHDLSKYCDVVDINTKQIKEH